MFSNTDIDTNTDYSIIESLTTIFHPVMFLMSKTANKFSGEKSKLLRY